jgi:hypothetical protein
VFVQQEGVCLNNRERKMLLKILWENEGMKKEAQEKNVFLLFSAAERCETAAHRWRSLHSRNLFIYILIIFQF